MTETQRKVHGRTKRGLGITDELIDDYVAQAKPCSTSPSSARSAGAAEIVCEALRRYLAAGR